jgi:fibronectin-binding autotransporter adhesin
MSNPPTPPQPGSLVHPNTGSAGAVVPGDSTPTPPTPVTPVVPASANPGVTPTGSQFQSISKVVADSAPALASEPLSVHPVTGGGGGGPVPPSLIRGNPNSGLPKRSWRPSGRLLSVAGVAAIIALLVGYTLLPAKKPAPDQSTASATGAHSYATTTIPLAGLSTSGQQLTTGSAQQFSVNGQLQINNTAVVAPTATPNAPELGQIYLSNANNQLYYYDGTSFVNLGGGKVVSIQGQTGAVSFTSGGGVSINGTTITNTGVTGLSGTANQISVSAASGAITLSLPQNIAPGSAPTFAAIQVGSLTARPGDTGLVVGNNTQDLALQGANTTISDSNSGFTSQLTFATPTANTTLVIPNVSGTICTSSGNCTGSGTGVELQPTSPGIAQTGNINISGTVIAGAFNGDGSNLINLNATNITTGTLAVTNGGTGATTAPGALTNLGAAASGINSDITSLTNLSSITPSSSLTIGSANQALSLQGSAATTFSAADSGYTTTLEFATPTTDASILVPNTSGTVAVAASGPLELDGDGNLSCPNCLVSTGSSGGTVGVISVNSFTGAISVAAGTGLNLTNNSGTITIAANQDISTTATPTFGGLTLNGDLGVGVGTPQYPIDVSGNVNVSGEYLIDGVPICTSGGCTAGGGSGSYIQNSTSIQQDANLAIEGSSSTNIVALVRGATGQTANIFAVQTSTGTNLLTVTPSGQVGVATALPNYPLDVNGDINTNGSLRVNGTAVCSSTSGCTPVSGSSNYIQNGTSLQVANFGVQSTSASSIGGVIRGAASQTADLLQTQANNGTILFSSSANGNAYVSGKLGVNNSSPSYQLDVVGDANITGDYYIDGTPICTSSGCVTNGGSGSYIQNGTAVQAANLAIQSQSAGSIGALVKGAASQTANIFDVQNAGGTNLFSVTPAGTANVATSLVVGNVVSPTYSLEVAGDANITGSYRINGVAVCTASGCAASGGSGNYLQNTTTLESENFSIQSAAATNSPTAVLEQATGQTGDLLDLDATGGSIVAAINPSGQLRVGGATAYTSALNVGTNSSTTALGGITLGTDTDLYRSASGTLKTDGTFQAAEFQESGADFATGLVLQSTTTNSTRSTNLTFTDNEATPQSISLRKEGNNLVVLDNSGNVQLGFSPSTDGILFGNALDTDLYRSGTDALTTDGALTVSGGFTSSGTTVFKNTTNSTTAVTVQNAAGTNLFVADTSDQRIGIDTTSPPAFPLDVNGTINTSTQYDVGGAEVCNSAGCAAASGSGYYIQNGTTVQTNANLAIQSAAVGDVGATIEGAVSQSANLLQVQDSNANVLDQINAAGILSVQSSTTSGALNIGTNSSTTAAGGIYFGTDTDLYRSAANNLTTDDALNVAGLLQGSAGLNVTGAAVNLNASSNFGTNINTGTSTGAVNIGNSASGGALTLQSAAAINLTAGAASTIQTTTGTLTIQGGASAGTVSLGTSTTLSNVGVALAVTGGTTLTLKSTTTSGVTLDSGTTGAVNVGNGSNSKTIQIGAASANVTDTINIGNNTNTGTSTISKVTIGSLKNSSSLVLQGGSGGILVQSGASSTTAFQIQNSSAATLFDVDTTNTRIGVGTATPAYSLDVVGDINASGTLKVAGLTACSASGGVVTCAGSGGGGSYINNGTSVQTADFNIQGTAVGQVVATIAGASGQTADLLDLKDGSGNKVVTVNNTGSVAVETSTNSATAFQVQNSSGTAALSVNTSTLSTTLQAGTDTVTLGSNTITDQNMGDSNWTNTGWSTTSTSATNNSGNTSPLSTSQFTPTSGTKYEISYTFSGSANAGTVVVSMGGVTVPTYTFTGNASQENFTDTRVITATNSTGLLTFTPSSTFLGTISAVSVQTIVSIPATLTVNNASGNPSVQVTASSNVTNTFIGGSNGASGTGSGSLNSTGTHDTAVGANALQNSTTPTSDTALGYGALQSDTSGSLNTGIGDQALQDVTYGTGDTAVGSQALAAVVQGSQNTAVGVTALTSDTSGFFNTAVGANALGNITTGASNTAVGSFALNQAATPGSNAALGINALRGDITGNSNTALGANTGYTNNSANDTTTGVGNTFIGADAGQGQGSYQSSNSVALGIDATVNQSNAIVLGCTTGVNNCGTTPTVGIGSQYAPNSLTVSPSTYGTNGTAGTSSTITQSGTTITGSGTTFTSGMVGGTIYYADGTIGTITGYTSATQLTTAVSKAISTSATYTIVYGGFNVTSTGAALLQPSTDGTVLQVDNASGSSLLTVNSSTSNITVSNSNLCLGSCTGGAKLNIGNTANIGELINETSTNDVLDLQNNGTNVVSVGSTGNTLFENSTNSTMAFQIQNQAGTSNLFIADTTDSKIGIGLAPTSTGSALQILGGISESSNLTINTAATNTGNITKAATTGTGGVNANDVVIMNSSAQVVDTTTARDSRVYGVALGTVSSGSTSYMAISGNATVNATGPINVGDQLVTSTTSGRVVTDNNATTGVLGIALTSLASGNGTVSVSLGISNGQYTPNFRPATDSTSTFNIQNAGGTAFFTADSSDLRVTVTNLVITAALTVDGHVITGNSSGTTTAAIATPLGSTGTCSLTPTNFAGGNDTSGTITLTPGGTGIALGTQCTVSFANTYGSYPHVVVSPADSGSQARGVYAAATSDTTFTIGFASAGSSGVTYTYNYFIAQ